MKLKRILPLVLSIFMAGSMFVGCTNSTVDENSSNNNNTENNVDGDGGGSTDTGSTDTGSTDTGSTDTGSTDTGSTDTGSTDTGSTDTGSTDTGSTDTGSTDTDGDEEEVDVSTLSSTTVYLVGDSTVCSFSDSYYLPRYGYGTQLYNYLNSDKVTIKNLALSGRSSLSFLTEDNYTTLKTSITEGDYLIIGFGHNDEKSDDADRFTDPNPDYKTATNSNGTASFQYTLYENYIKLAEDAGATAILCTPIVRYNSSANYDGSSGHITSDGDYPEAIRTLAEDTDTALIDLTAITKADYISKGTDAQYYHAFTGTKDGVPSGMDTTHINMYGAKMVAYELVTALKSTSCSLKYYVNSDITAPTYDTDYQAAINTSYVEPDYDSFDASANSDHLLSGEWYKTAMGNIGGNSVSPFTITGDGTTFTVGSSSAKGKITSTQDGFAAAFRQISVNDNFTITATATVTTAGESADKQSAFGIMLRDDIYIDTRNDDLNSNYVAAGVLGYGSGYAIFSRESTKLTSLNSVTTAVNSTYELKIQRLGQAVYVTVGSYTYTYTDFDFVSVDNDYMYLCLFATRDITVQFTNVSYTYDGEAQGA